MNPKIAQAAELKAKGIQNKAIASALGVSEPTVYNYLKKAKSQGLTTQASSETLDVSRETVEPAKGTLQPTGISGDPGSGSLEGVQPIGIEDTAPPIRNNVIMEPEDTQETLSEIDAQVMTLFENLQDQVSQLAASQSQVMAQLQQQATPLFGKPLQEANQPTGNSISARNQMFQEHAEKRRQNQAYKRDMDNATPIQHPNYQPILTRLTGNQQSAIIQWVQQGKALPQDLRVLIESRLQQY